VVAALVASCPGPAPSVQPAGDFVVVARAIDGDTLELAGGERVRLIGVDTPETKHPQKPVERFGAEASAFTSQLVAVKRVRLEYDHPAPRQVRADARVRVPRGLS
jgi:micrococcal nuclease